MKEKRVCERCGRSFETHERGKHPYCSQECREYMLGTSEKSFRGEMRKMMAELAEAYNVVKTCSLEELMQAKTKPKAVSVARWRMELKRRMAEEHFENCIKV